jgi:holo-[acyl-carrier protein] synthase
VIVGVGIDVVDVARFERSLERTPALRTRLFVAAERGLAVRSLAARFAAKEALAKALGAPPGLRWTDAEVRTAPDGRPSLHVAGTVEAVATRLGVARWHLSLSHDGGIATAIVIAESQ